MSGCYVSPIPTAMMKIYSRRDAEGNAVVERVHLFPARGGGAIPCYPPCCRECERERTIHDHGPQGEGAAQ